MKNFVLCAALLLVVGGSMPVSAEMTSTGPAKTSPRIILADASAQKPRAARNCPTVEIFVTSWCGYCKMMEQALHKKGIAYTTYDVEKDDKAAKIYRELHGRGVPLVRVGSKVVYGYDPDTVISYVNGR
ncbi:MAG: glutaredoxin domain-containing protein [Geobacteraceae bacterium]